MQNKARESRYAFAGGVGILGSIFIASLIHVAAALLIYASVSASQRYEAVQQGKIIVSSRLLESAGLGSRNTPPKPRWTVRSRQEAEPRTAVERGARRTAKEYVGTAGRRRGPALEGDPR